MRPKVPARSAPCFGKHGLYSSHLTKWRQERRSGIPAGLSPQKRGPKSSRFLSALQDFVQLYQHPAMLTENSEDLSVSELVSQPSKLRVLLAKLHEIRARREKVIVFARRRTMQGILAKVLQAEFQLPVRIVNGETKLRAAGSLNISGVKTRNAILHDFRRNPGFDALILSPFVAGRGLTIIEANHVVHYGRWWNPAVGSQATDRVYRIGQTKPVSVYLPILRDLQQTGLRRRSRKSRLLPGPEHPVNDRDNSAPSK